jgi:hypothetical protein
MQFLWKLRLLNFINSCLIYCLREGWKLGQSFAASSRNQNCYHCYSVWIYVYNKKPWPPSWSKRSKQDTSVKAFGKQSNHVARNFRFYRQQEVESATSISVGWLVGQNETAGRPIATELTNRRQQEFRMTLERGSFAGPRKNRKGIRVYIWQGTRVWGRDVKWVSHRHCGGDEEAKGIRVETCECPDKGSVDGPVCQSIYTNQQIFRALSPPLRVSRPDKKPGSVAFLPYVRLVFNYIGRMLSQHIESVGFCLRKMSGFLWSARHMGCSIDTSLKEHQWYIYVCVCVCVCVKHLDKSVMEEHSVSLGHCIQVPFHPPPPSNPDTWITSSVRRMRSIPTIWTKGMASVWASHGNL